MDDDIILKAQAVASMISEETPWNPIAEAIQNERTANAALVENLRDRLRNVTFASDANHAVADLTRKWAKEIVGINAIFVDDDLRVLAHLADLAVTHGLTKGLNAECQKAVIRQFHARRGEILESLEEVDEEK